jgi:ComF family protein
LICRRCLRAFKKLQPPHCTRCGTPLGQEDPFCQGGDWSFTFDRVRSYLLFDDAIKPFLHLLKYKQFFTMGRSLGRLLAKHTDPEYFTGVDFIIPIPLHPTRQRDRGYNQSLMLAQGIQKRYRNLPIFDKAVQRIRQTGTQTKLTRSGRQHNIAGIFAVPEKFRPQLQGRTILLVDDVFTTGATVNEGAATLKEAGAGEVRVLTLARA